MKMKDVSLVAALNNEMEAICKMQRVLEKNNKANVAVGISTTYICHSNERHEITSPGMIRLFEKALSERLSEIEKEIELL